MTPLISCAPLLLERSQFRARVEAASEVRVAIVKSRPEQIVAEFGLQIERMAIPQFVRLPSIPAGKSVKITTLVTDLVPTRVEPCIAQRISNSLRELVTCCTGRRVCYGIAIRGWSARNLADSGIAIWFIPVYHDLT